MHSSDAAIGRLKQSIVCTSRVGNRYQLQSVQCMTGPALNLQLSEESIGLSRNEPLPTL